MFTTRAINVIIAAALLFANQAYATGAVEARAALIATNSGKSPALIPFCTTLHERILNMPLSLVAACNPPNNGDHHAGSSCKFYTGPSDKSPVYSGSMLFVSVVVLPDRWIYVFFIIQNVRRSTEFSLAFDQSIRIRSGVGYNETSVLYMSTM